MNLITKGQANYELIVYYTKEYENEVIGKVSGRSTSYFTDLKKVQGEINWYINHDYNISKIEINKLEKSNKLIESEDEE